MTLKDVMGLIWRYFTEFVNASPQM